MIKKKNNKANSNNMPWYDRVLLSTGLYRTALVAFLALSLMLGIDYISATPTRAYAKHNLSRIMRMQEKKLNIRHFGTPKTESSNIFYFLLKPEAYGHYDDATHTIYIRGHPLILWSVDDRKSTTKILNHELGHYYCYNLRKSIKNHTWLNNESLKELPDDEKICYKLIDEGVAEYFERKMTDPEDRGWILLKPKSPRDEHTIRETGYSMVYPIIDKYGKRGITYLIQNLPTSKDLHDLYLYQERVLKALDPLHKLK